MKKNIVAMTVSRNEEERNLQIQEINASGQTLYSLIHLHSNFSVKEIDSILRILKRYDTHMVMLDGIHLPDEVIHELSDLIKQSGMETLVISQRMSNDNKRYMFLLCHVSVDIKMIISLLLEQHTTDLYVLIDNPLSMHYQSIEKLKQIAELLSIEIHYFSEVKTL